MAYAPQAPNCFAYNGNPNGSVAGNASSGAGGTPPDLCWDTTDGSLFVCTASGTAGSAVWVAVAGSSVIVSGVGAGLTYSSGTLGRAQWYDQLWPVYMK